MDKIKINQIFQIVVLKIKHRHLELFSIENHKMEEIIKFVLSKVIENSRYLITMLMITKQLTQQTASKNKTA